MFYDTSLKTWDAYRGVLSAKLTRSEWTTVSYSVVWLQTLDAAMQARMPIRRPEDEEHPTEGGVVRLTEGSAAALPGALSRATDAYNALCCLAQTDRTTGVLPDESGREVSGREQASGGEAPDRRG